MTKRPEAEYALNEKPFAPSRNHTFSNVFGNVIVPGFLIFVEVGLSDNSEELAT